MATVVLVGPSGMYGADFYENVGIGESGEVRSTATTTPAIQEEHQAWVHEIARRVEEAMCPK
jgi:hypothetical protein